MKFIISMAMQKNTKITTIEYFIGNNNELFKFFIHLSI